jgi:NAD(P)-dependent dehydrogenase (short-subunit alcohol dehydrogenase family)
VTSQLRFDGRVAIITGAGGGLGREYALLLAQRGTRVVVNDLGADKAEATVAEIRATGGEAVVNGADVADPASATSIIDQALATWGRLDIVVNNAGVGGGTLSTPEITEHVVATHLFGTANILRAALPKLEASSYGRIVNTSSGSVFGIPRSGDYAAAKGGILALSRVLANELLARPELDIKINVIMPVAQTPMMPVASDPDFASMMEFVFAPSRVAAFVALLCHERLPCTGETFTVGGGRAARVLLQTTAGHLADNPTPEAYLEHFDDIMAGIDPRQSNGGLSDLLARAGRTPVSISDVR